MTIARKAGKFTPRQIEAATLSARESNSDVWLTDPGARGEGRFMCRCTPAGARIFMFRYSDNAGRRDTMRIASFDPKGIEGLTVEAARKQAGELTRLYQSGVRDLRQHFEREAAAAAEAREASERAKEAAQRKALRGSLSALIDAYVKTLVGRQSYYDAENILRLHVKAAFPEVAALPAAAVKAEQFRDVLARLIEDGKGRTAAKLRAYLRAAYSLAMRAGLDPTIPEGLSAFDVEANPIERLPSLSKFNRALDRALTLPELVAFWSRVTALPASPATDALRACVLLGGQRPTQLLRLTANDVDTSGGSLVLLDIKGRNRHANPRRHLLPIPAELAPMLKRRKGACETPDALIFGATRKETVGALVGEICDAMKTAKELERGPFQLRDLRRTAETHLAAMGVSTDVRAQIQSHGLGGIQARHYDRHDYMPEKRAALALWADRLQAKPPAAVTDIATAKRRRKVAA